MVDVSKGPKETYASTHYRITSPPSLCGGVVITGSLVSDGAPRGPSGDVSAFDLRIRAEKCRFNWVAHAGGLAAARGKAIRGTRTCSETVSFGWTGATGQRSWYFQTVRRHLWDYNLQAQPMLVSGRREGSRFRQCTGDQHRIRFPSQSNDSPDRRSM